MSDEPTEKITAPVSSNTELRRGRIQRTETADFRAVISDAEQDFLFAPVPESAPISEKPGETDSQS